MAYLAVAGAGYSSVAGINNRRPNFFIPIIPNNTISTLYSVASLCRCCREHGFSSASESAWTDFPVENAYELLGVSETSSFDEIKASFRKLAKETHPDLAESRNDSTASRRFVQILAAYEAEERSSYETPEVLHLVSGRDLFGMVCLANRVPEISITNNEKLTSFRSFHSGLCQSITHLNVHRNAERSDDFETHQGHSSKTSSIVSDAYRHLELHISGRVVATASRALPRCCSDEMQTEDTEDHIHVFLNLYEDPKHISSDFWKDYLANGAVGRRIRLGSISGLGSSPDEGCCYVYNDKGTKTHVIMKHRTLMVKHMHWYEVGEKVSVCECRCTRARLPPSKFWLFEPRCGFHDIGGWYVETYGKDKNGRTMPSQRFWDGLDYSEQADRRLHPAMYLFALAYRTLDLEYAKASKRSFRNVVGAQMFRILHWCKKLVQ
ncbi:hypothetical protein JHK85_002323 [Glycine max]|nr:hypothetical protein JHK85_002323 [Glycine max]